VADLRGSGSFRRFRQDGEASPNSRMTHDLTQSRHRADLESTAGFANSAEFFDSAEVDHVTRPLDAVLEPVEAVQTTGQNPRTDRASEKIQRIGRGGRLKQSESGHHTPNYSHTVPPHCSGGL